MYFDKKVCTIWYCDFRLGIIYFSIVLFSKLYKLEKKRAVPFMPSELWKYILKQVSEMMAICRRIKSIKYWYNNCQYPFWCAQCRHSISPEFVFFGNVSLIDYYFKISVQLYKQWKLIFKNNIDNIREIHDIKNPYLVHSEKKYQF